MLRPPVIPPLTLSQCAERAQQPAPALARRLAAVLYEGVLLFGVVMFVGLFYSVIVGQKHALEHRTGMQITLFLALSVYFIGFWARGGQTLAMKTWHVRLVRQDGLSPTLTQSAMRFVLSWLWFMPPLALSWLAQWHSSREIWGLLGAWIVIYATLTRMLPRQQLLHDVICRTAIIDTRP